MNPIASYPTEIPSNYKFNEPIIPEPATMALFGSGLMGAFVKRRKQKQDSANV